MRRTQTIVEQLCIDKFNPFSELNSELGRKIVLKKESQYVVSIIDESDNDKWLGYLLALSTFSNVRGLLALEIRTIIFDEFVPEKHAHKIKGEAEALFNAYETINRNRELQGAPPLKLLCLSNSDQLVNPLFIELKIIKQCETMKRRGIEYVNNGSSGLTLVVLSRSPISAAKGETALYKLTRGSRFETMALENEFMDERAGDVRSLPLREFTPVVGVGEITVYSHKSEGYYYISEHRQGSPDIYGMGDIELAQFRRKYIRIWDAYLAKTVVFETYVCEAILRKAFGAA